MAPSSAPAQDSILSVSMASLVENVLKDHAIGGAISDIHLASRKAEEAASRRYEAAGWLRKTAGLVISKDLPDAPSEEEFRLGLRNGLILCTALNKVYPGAVPKIVVNHTDSVILPDGAALSAYQYFENVRNFLVAGQELGLPSFEASDLEQGGKSSRIVDCILALKSYGEWKQMGGYGSWKHGGNLRPTNIGKAFVRKNSNPFSNSLSRSSSMCGKHLNEELSVDSDEMEKSSSLNMLVRAVLSDKKPDEVPLLVESMLSKVMEEFERRIANQNEMVKTTLKELADGNKSFAKLKVSKYTVANFHDNQAEVDESECTKPNKEICYYNSKNDDAAKDKLQRQYLTLDKQQRDIQELKHVLGITKSGVEFMQMKYHEEIRYLGKHVYGLAQAASNYNKVLEENRKLYNQVQDLKGSIRVYCRVRPFLPGQVSSNTIGSIDDGNITILTPVKYGKEGHRSFTFNKVFGPSASQEEVFSDTQPLIRSVLDGYNVCIFAYGQTGSGKTFTMSGPKQINDYNRGVNYRALGDLFNLAEQRSGAFSYEISVQMIEIYNEQVRDLLVNDGLNRRLEIRNGSQNGLNVPDANLVPVASTYDVVELMNIGQKNRAVGATALNDRSSRSHSCLTVHVEGKDLTSGTILRGCMHLVDLAGSERVDKSEVTGDRLKEAQHINRSLSALGDVISALAQKNSHVPYRNSKLTQLLQDSLGGQAKTLMFVHISPELDAVGETLSTLKFAERVSTVELGAAKMNKDSGDVRELKDQIAGLKAALARREEESNHQGMPDASKMRIRAPSPSNLYSNCRGEDNSRQPMEEVGNIEVRNNPSTRQRKPSYDLQELLLATDSHPWPDTSPHSNYINNNKGHEKDLNYGEWVDKVVVKDGSTLKDLEGECKPSPDFFYQNYISDTTLYSEQRHKKNGVMGEEGHEIEIQRNRFDSMTADDSDVATSDSSEADLLWQYNISKIVNAVNGSGLKNKKPQTNKAANNSPDFRTPTRALIPSPSRKSTSTSNRLARQPSSSGLNGKRPSSGGRMGGGK